MEAGFVCFMSTRAHVKMVEDQKGAIAGTETEEVHLNTCLNIRPRHAGRSSTIRGRYAPTFK